MKIKVMFDSSVGWSKDQIEQWGGAFVPLIINLDGQEYKDGIELNQEQLIERLLEGASVATAAATLGDLEEAYRSALKDADHVVYIPLSKNLSSSYNNAVMVSKEDEFEGKVTVIDSTYITPWTYIHAEEILKKAEEGDLEALVRLINFYQEDVIGYLIPETMLHLKNGGRISKASYILGSLAKINPVIAAFKGSVTDEVHGVKPIKGKGVMGAAKKGTEALFGEWKEKYTNSDAEYQISYMAVGKYADEFLEYITKEAAANGFSKELIKETKLGGAIVAHTGPNMYLLALRKIAK